MNENQDRRQQSPYQRLHRCQSAARERKVAQRKGSELHQHENMNSMASNNPEASEGVTDGANSYDSTDNERRRTVDGSAVGSATAKSNSSKSFFSLKKIKSSLSRKNIVDYIVPPTRGRRSNSRTPSVSGSSRWSWNRDASALKIPRGSSDDRLQKRYSSNSRITATLL